MKTRIRKPSIKKSFSARTTGRLKRAAKRSINPLYGKKGIGFIKNPSRSIKNSIYHKTTVGVSGIAKPKKRTRIVTVPSHATSSKHSVSTPLYASKKRNGTSPTVLIVLGIMFLIGGLGNLYSDIFTGFVGLIVGGICLYVGIIKRKNLK